MISDAQKLIKKIGCLFRTNRAKDEWTYLNHHVVVILILNPENAVIICKGQAFIFCKVE